MCLSRISPFVLVGRFFLEIVIHEKKKRKEIVIHGIFLLSFSCSLECNGISSLFLILLKSISLFSLSSSLPFIGLDRASPTHPPFSKKSSLVSLIYSIFLSIFYFICYKFTFPKYFRWKIRFGVRFFLFFNIII